MLEDLKSALVLAILSIAILATGWAGYYAGRIQGRRDVAKYIPQIRELERISALAPRNREDN